MRPIRIAVLAFVLAGCLSVYQLRTHAQDSRQSPPTENSISHDVIDKEMLAWELTKNKDKSSLAKLLSEDFAEITDFR